MKKNLSLAILILSAITIFLAGFIPSIMIALLTWYTLRYLNAGILGEKLVKIIGVTCIIALSAIGVLYYLQVIEESPSLLLVVDVIGTLIMTLGLKKHS